MGMSTEQGAHGKGVHVSMQNERWGYEDDEDTGSLITEWVKGKTG